MGKLMPVNVRNKGLAFFVDGDYVIDNETEHQIIMLVDQQTVESNKGNITCSCEFFQKREFCPHMATMEAYQKSKVNEAAAPKRIVSKLSIQNVPRKTSKEEKKIPSPGSVFLENLDIVEDYQITDLDEPYHVELSGQDIFGGDIEWKMKIYLPQKKKSYVVRHIGNFLKALRDHEPTWFGSQGYTMAIEEFDEPSQAFLGALLEHASAEYQYNYQFSAFAANYMSYSTRSMTFEGYYFDHILKAISQLDYLEFIDRDDKVYQEIYLQDFQADDNLFQFEVSESAQNVVFSMSTSAPIYYKKSGVLREDNTFFKLSQQQEKLLNQLLTIPKVDDRRQLEFHKDETLLLSGYLDLFKELGPVQAPDSYTVKDFDAVFYFDLKNKHYLTLELIYRFDNIDIHSHTALSQLPFSYNHKKHARIFNILKSSGLKEQFTSTNLINSAEKKFHFFTKTLPLLEQYGRVHVSEALEDLYKVDHASIEIGQLDGLLDISFDFQSIDDHDIDQALKALMTKKSYFMKKSGQIVAFDDGTKRISDTLAQLRGQTISDGKLKLNKVEALRVSKLFENSDQVTFNQNFQQLTYDISHPESYPLDAIDVKTELRDYQILGIKWLSSLNKYGFGGILADDMGLGKTIQAISFIKAQLEKGKQALIIAPASLIYNWKDEFEKFAPDLDVAIAYGAKVDRIATIEEGHQITLTSYPSFRQDSATYRKFTYDLLILDEAQSLKNNQTRISQALQEFEAKTTFALSGTPIENNLTEVWSIFQVVMPGLFPNKREFKRMSAELVAHYISPFILRRRKKEVLEELPELIEKTYTNELNEQQKTIYLAQLQQIQGQITGEADQYLSRNRFEILAALTRLRQICDTPQLFMPEVTETSGKMESLKELMTMIRQNGRRPLVFSQFTSMLELVKNEFDQMGIETFTLTGQTPSQKRQEMTKAFNEGQKDAFLISLKAGGVGLNLTGADTVILIDLWWNPAVEMQAISRAHRMGQKQNVEVFRLITEGTIEEKILHLQEEKRDLVSTVLDGEETRANLTVEDLKEILGIE